MEAEISQIQSYIRIYATLQITDFLKLPPITANHTDIYIYIYIYICMMVLNHTIIS